MTKMSRSLIGLCTLSTLSLLAACALNTPRLQQPSQIRSQTAATSQRAIPKPATIQMPSPNQNERPAGSTINTIVLHHTAMAGDARAVGNYFARPEAKTSSHYIVDRTGYLVQPVADNLRSWHAGRSEFNGVGDVNNFSIGIEICNLGDSVEAYSDAQYDGIIRLVAYLVSEYRIPLANITRHRDIAIPLGRKIDTSNNFSMARVNEGVRAVLNGTYRPPALNTPAEQPQLPAFREVIVQAGQTTLEDIADIHLDNPARWVELQAFNPQVSAKQLQVGQKIRVPNHIDFKIYEQHQH